MKSNQTILQTLTVILLLMVLALPAVAEDTNLPDPDGKAADMTKPVQVYILLGQSNMLGAGRIAGDKDGTLEQAAKEKKLYPYLVDDAGNWTERKDVRNVRVMGSGTGAMRRFNNEWMTITGGKIGPEIGIGYHVGHATDAPARLVNLRSVHTLGREQDLRFDESDVDRVDSLKGQRPVLFADDEDPWMAAIHERQSLAPAARIEGPAIIEQPDTTTVVTRGWRAVVHTSRNLILEKASTREKLDRNGQL